MSTSSAAFGFGLPVSFDARDLSFHFGPGMFAPAPEMRSLQAIRGSLLDPRCTGPDPVYSICMDVGRTTDKQELEQRWLLFGIVGYAAGCLGREPVRSQGHVHAIAPHSGWSPPELFEIWQGRAVIYMQEAAADNPGRCFAVQAGPGDHVIVPPGWAHFVANADPQAPMVFAALCDRQYGFVYDGVRSRGGLAWFPTCVGSAIEWQPNPAYGASTLCVGAPCDCSEFGVHSGIPLYRQFEQHPDTIQWVSEPSRVGDRWSGFNPLGPASAIIYSRT